MSQRLHREIVPIIQGGTGSQSESLEMPTTMPSKLEAGNLNVAALAGWLEALRQCQTGDSISRLGHMTDLAKRLHDGLASIDHIRVFGRSNQLPIASIAVDGLSPTDAAAILDAEYGIETRAGMHCAALIHACLGSEQEGTLRISGGHTSTVSDIDAAVEAIRSITTTLHG